MRIKEWFLEKEFTQNERYIMSCAEISVERETEKAYLLKWFSDYGNITRWIPKSCIYTQEEYAKIIEVKSNKMMDGLTYNEKLVEYAKANNIKGVRIGLKTTTLIKKIQDAGFEVPARA